MLKGHEGKLAPAPPVTHSSVVPMNNIRRLSIENLADILLYFVCFLFSLSFLKISNAAQIYNIFLFCMLKTIDTL
jgi:hypothetical protein